jgi:hypothetical protein
MLVEPVGRARYDLPRGRFVASFLSQDAPKEVNPRLPSSSEFQLNGSSETPQDQKVQGTDAPPRSVPPSEAVLEAALKRSESLTKVAVDLGKSLVSLSDADLRTRLE